MAVRCPQLLLAVYTAMEVGSRDRYNMVGTRVESCLHATCSSRSSACRARWVGGSEQPPCCNLLQPSARLLRGLLYTVTTRRASRLAGTYYQSRSAIHSPSDPNSDRQQTNPTQERQRFSRAHAVPCKPCVCVFDIADTASWHCARCSHHGHALGLGLTIRHRGSEGRLWHELSPDSSVLALRAWPRAKVGSIVYPMAAAES